MFIDYKYIAYYNVQLNKGLLSKVAASVRRENINVDHYASMGQTETFTSDDHVPPQPSITTMAFPSLPKSQSKRSLHDSTTTSVDLDTSLPHQGDGERSASPDMSVRPASRLRMAGLEDVESDDIIPRDMATRLTASVRQSVGSAVTPSLERVLLRKVRAMSKAQQDLLATVGSFFYHICILVYTRLKSWVSCVLFVISIESNPHAILNILIGHRSH